MACVVVAYLVMACVVVAYMATADIAVALRSYGLHEELQPLLRRQLRPVHPVDAGLRGLRLLVAADDERDEDVEQQKVEDEDDLNN